MFPTDPNIPEAPSSYADAAKRAIKPAPIPATEWRLRCELAACYRLFVHFGWTDLIFTHLSARLPDKQHYLLNPYGLLFDEITASNLVRVELATGNIVNAEREVNAAGHAIHAAVLNARPEVDVVLHSHTRAGIAVSCMRDGLLNISQQAIEIEKQVCYMDYAVFTNEPESCKQLAQALGRHDLMIMRNHGLLAVGRTLAQAFYALYMLESACKIQVDALAGGGGERLVYPSAEACEGLRKEAAEADAPQRSWKALLRMLERKQIDYCC